MLVSTLVVGGGVVVELEAQGVGAVVGLALLGALLGVWVVVYDRTMCRAEPARWPVVMTGAGVGAALLPAVGSLQIAFGGLVWAGVLVGLLAWGLANSVRWADRRPRRSFYP